MHDSEARFFLAQINTQIINNEEEKKRTGLNWGDPVQEAKVHRVKSEGRERERERETRVKQ